MKQMNEEQLEKCKDLMINAVSNMVETYHEEIIKTVNELFDESDVGKATLEIPIKLKVEFKQNTGYVFTPSITVKKVSEIKDSLDSVVFDPFNPDLPGIWCLLF